MSGAQRCYLTSLRLLDGNRDSAGQSWTSSGTDAADWKEVVGLGALQGVDRIDLLFLGILKEARLTTEGRGLESVFDESANCRIGTIEAL